MNRRLSRRMLLASLAAPMLGATTRPVRAEEERPLTIVVPYGPGGTTDMLGRMFAQHLWTTLGRPVHVENRPGAGSSVGAAEVARSMPDGNTLLIATSSTLAINPTLYSKLPYDPAALAPVGMLASVPLALVVHPSVDAGNVASLVSASKRKPGGLSYGSAGVGSPQHLAAEMFKAATGADLTHVPFGGSAAAVNNLLGGQLDLMFADLAPVLAHVQGKKLRPLGVTSRQRQATLPEVPTVAETPMPALEQFEAVAWQCVVAPAGTPKEVVQRLNAALVRMLEQPGIREKLLQAGVEPASGSPEQLAAYIRAESARWAKLIKATGITAG
jgi:tripartite-type tricarboxylate transporter receptor subunit TctC